MSRLETKCLMVAAATHGLLMAIFLFGSAFFVANSKKENLLPLNMVPSILVDAAMSGGGGNPNLRPSDEKVKGETLIPQPPAPQPPPVAQKRVETKPPPPDPKPVEPRKSTEEVQSLKPPSKEPTTKSKPRVDINNVVKRPDATAANAKVQADAQARERAGKAARTAAITEARAKLAAGFSSGLAVEVAGPGGAAYANYAQFVSAVFDEAWVVPNEMSDQSSVAEATVVIARNGDVISKRVTKPSGNPVLDKSAQRTLDKVTTIGRPFPAEAKESQRTFIIEFNLKTKRASG